MEYGLNEQLPIYAGGLGVLAGDYLKAAYDINAPMVAIGILWAQDYTEQYIGENGQPYDVYPNYDYSFLKDTGISVKVRVRGADVECKVKMVDQYGNIPLYLLDTNFRGSEHGWMTSKLYGGVAQDRVAAEIILGIGGVRVLRALGIDVDVYHFNEGHAVFAGLELIREKMQNQGMSFEKAWEKTIPEVIFTTHTPVEAGNEKHDHGLLQHMEAYNGLNYDQMNQIGGDPFNMTVAALRLSQKANAVSKLHGHTARGMWKGVTTGSPIISITNGVHNQTWQDRSMKEAFDKGMDLWSRHFECKKELINYVKQKEGVQLDPNVLTVGFARRAAPYKRSDLIFRNTDLIEPLLREKRLQLIFSGKAHPNDQLGKSIISDLVKMSEKYGNSVVFLENYNMQVARFMVRGCDVWLNNPRRPLEASGTSGMKAAMNGVLNLSVVDGWVGEGVQHGVSGWILQETIKQSQDWDQDARDLQALYSVLLNEVIPVYYDQRERWIEMMRASMDMSQWQFSSKRMIQEYFDVLYEPTYQTQKQLEISPYMYQQKPQQYQPTYQ